MGGPIVVLIALLVGSYYLWAVRASGTRFEWKHDLGDFYDLLGRGFASGANSLPCSPLIVSTGRKTSATMNVA